MNDPITSYPLCWPKGQPRCKEKICARFKISPDRARREMLDELGRLGVDRVIISTNMELRQDGMPYINRRAPEDTGVAVYWKDIYNGRQMCIACDQYRTIHDNMRAIGKTVEALRTIERHGGSQLLDRAFTGFAALPAPIEAAAPWYVTLGVSPDATEEQIRAAKIRLSRELHPDITGGDVAKEETLKLVNAAADEALKLRRAGQ